MSMARKLPNMTSNQTRMRVLDFLPTAYWVDGDTGMKQTTRQAWDNVFIEAAELAVIVPISEAVLDDAEFDIFGEITPRVNEAIGQRNDVILPVTRTIHAKNDGAVHALSNFLVNPRCNLTEDVELRII